MPPAVQLPAGKILYARARVMLQNGNGLTHGETAAEIRGSLALRIELAFDRMNHPAEDQYVCPDL